MTFLLMLPLAVFGLIAAITLAVELAVEITERRRVIVKSIRKVFRPIVIEGGKGKFAAVELPQAPTDDENAESIRIKLVR